MTQEPLPHEYRNTSPETLAQRIADAKARLGPSLVILGHHYQSDEVIRFADFTGDSLRLSQLAAAQKQARFIVFCGVHFMAESADVLSGPDQIVCLPNLHAGCSMADMADESDVREAMETIRKVAGAAVAPITYVNSTAAIKALTARLGGACCTSSNVRNVFEWALRPADQGGAGASKIFALPDQHLARNTALHMGYRLGDVALYDPALPMGGLTPQAIAQATFLVWKGHCYVHQRFTPAHIAAVRARHPGITVIVHPECPCEVVRLADLAGSTEQIIRAVENAAPGSSWAIGTEANMVGRLAKRFPDRFIRVLSDTPAFCVQMARIDLPHLAWTLDNLLAGRVVNRVSVDPAIAADARLALERMVRIKAVAEVMKPSQWTQDTP